jgi:hypothetical protein
MAANVAFTEWSSQLVLNTLSNSAGTITKIAPASFTAGGSAISSTLYLALLTGVPTTDTGTGLVEFTGYSGGVRPSITFSAAAAGTATTSQKITAPSSGTITYSITAAGPTTIAGIAICCVASTGTALSMTAASGNVIWYGDLTSTVSVVATDVLTFNSNQIVIDLY